MIDYRTFTLANGLQVVHHYDDATSHVAVNLLYDVGARDESPSLTGMAHLFEHLMFGGSVNVPDYDHAIEMAGGSNNAWTSNDFTNFYDIVAAENLDTALWAESDRMLQLAFSPQSLEVQRNVVMEEFKQVCINKPYGDFGHRLRKLLFRTHPYRYPTIGKELAHIEHVTMDDVQRFFYTHYAPNNAVLAIAGPVEFDQVLERVQYWFGDIPRRDIAPRMYEAETPITSPRREVVDADVPQSRIAIAFHMAAHGAPGYREADLITDILASGNSSRFYRRLVMGTDLFTAADASISGSEEPGFLMVTARLRRDDEETLRKAEDALWRELDNLVNEHVADYELERALNRFESNRTFAHINYLSKAQALAKAVMRGEDINEVVPAYRSVTPEDIKRTAAGIFVPDRSCTLIYKVRQPAD